MAKNETTVFRPRSLDELDALASDKSRSLTYVAGATDLMVQTAKWKQVRHLVDLTAVSELHDTIEVSDGGVKIGAAVDYSRIINHPVIAGRLPLLVEACRQIGSVQIQNRGSLGGNIANASPAGDSLPVLAVLDASLWIGPRENGAFEILKLDQVMTGPGQTVLKDNRYIAFIEIPFPEQDGQFRAFRKVGQRKAMAISKLSLAVLGWRKNNVVQQIRISTGSVAPRITRHPRTEQILTGKNVTEETIDQACNAIREEIQPISDIRSTEEYRRQITAEVLRDVLHTVLKLGE